VSIADAAWLLPPLGGAALGLRMRSSVLAFLLGLAVVTASVVLWGYSVDNYSNNDCQPGEPCSTGEQVIRVVIPVCFLFGSTLFLVAFGRSLWNDFRARRWPGQSGQALGHGRKSD
jgi:hypothetical protein